MDFNVIGALYLAQSGCDCGDIPGFVPLTAARMSREQLGRALEKSGITARNMTPELETAVLEIETECERQGFINGFRMGVQLMRECTHPVAGGGAV